MGKKIVVVCDTNVLVSAVGWRGAEHQLYRQCRGGVLQLATSRDLLDELRRVLRYPKLRLSEEDAVAFEADIRAHALLVEPRGKIHAVEADLDDNRVLECAVAAGVRCIISGDRHFLKLREYDSISIVTAPDALRSLATHGSL